MQAGIYTDLDIEKYHSVDGVSRSGLMEFSRTPAHYWNRYLNPDRPASEPTEAMIFGNAFHTFVLEPHLFEQRYFVNNVQEPVIDEKPLKKDLQAEYGKELGADMYEEAKLYEAEQRRERDHFREQMRIKAEGKILLSNNQYETLCLMSESLSKHAQGMALIEGGTFEQSIFWNEPHTGELCKTRPDVWHDGFTADLKTIAAADERTFTQALVKHGYHLQAAMNREGIRENTGKDIKSHTFVCVEKTFPFSVAVYILDITALEFAHVKFKKLITDFAGSGLGM
jgi:exodeoxyribonuclease VIII